VLQDLFGHVGLVNETDDAHFSVVFVTNKRVSCVNFSDEVAPVPFYSLDDGAASIS
jgi:hypothetical protein